MRSARIRTSASFFSLSFQFNHILECDERKWKMTIKGDKSEVERSGELEGRPPSQSVLATPVPPAAVDAPPTRITYTLTD